jgi:hypothetical protein
MSQKQFVSLSRELKREIQAHLRPEEVTPELLNLVRAGLATHEHAFNLPHVTKESFLEYIGRAWDMGARQRRVVGMEVEGSVSNDVGITLNFACMVVLDGKRKGYV